MAAFTQRAIARKRGIPLSLLDAIRDDPDRFVKDVENNPRVIDFGTFVSEMKRHYERNNAGFYLFQDLDRELMRILFNSNTVRRTIRNNIGQEKADELYKQETQQTLPAIITRTQAKPAPVQMRPSLRSVRPYARRGMAIAGYQRSAGMRWTPAHSKFIQVRKARGIKPADITREYLSAFPSNPRSYESIRKKYYRL